MKFQEFRNIQLPKFTEYKVIMFPQSIKFLNPDNIPRVQRSYAKHPDVTLVARDQPSFDFMQKYFPQHVTLLTPDIVFSFGYIPNLRLPAESNILLFQRGDSEKVVDEENFREVFHEFDRKFDGKRGITVRDWGSDYASWMVSHTAQERSWLRTKNGLHIISSNGEVSVVDRLHGKNIVFLSKLCYKSAHLFAVIGDSTCPN